MPARRIVAISCNRWGDRARDRGRAARLIAPATADPVVSDGSLTPVGLQSDPGDVMLTLLLTLLWAPPQRLKPPDVRYVPTPQNVVEVMLEMAHVTAADGVYARGCCDRRRPFTAAQKYGARGVGIEIEPRLIRESLDNAAKAHVTDRVWFVNQDLFETDLSPATVVTMYLHPRMLLQLMSKLKQLRPGTRIVSHYYNMGEEWPPDESRDINSLPVYLWTVR